MERIGRYEILEELGRGAMGAVYRARDPQIGRIVAIKVINAANLSREELKRYQQRFRREAQTAGQMSHPGIITIHDIAEDEKGQPFLVMEYVEGATLLRILQPVLGKPPRPMELPRALDIAVQVADALDYAHKRGVVHRDIKPSNILVTPEWKAKIADFGIARFTDAEATHTTGAMGTPAYMAPEQVRGGALDARSDLFSLGATLYWMCTGHKPFPGDAMTEVSFKVVYTEPTPPRQLVPALPEAMETLLSRCLAKSPVDRYATARNMVEDLTALKEGKPIAATPAPKVGEGDQTVTTAGALPKSKKAGEETTRVVIPDVPGITPIPEREKRPLAAAGAQPAKRQGVMAALVLVLLGALFAAYWFWPTSTAPDGAQTAGVTQPGKPGTGAPKQPAKPVLMAALGVECKHNFKEATLEIFSGSRRILNEKLVGQSGAFGRTTGNLKTSVKVPAGDVKLRVRVVSTVEKDLFDEQAEIAGAISADGQRVLLVEFGRGSGAGFSKRKLQLKWR